MKKLLFILLMFFVGVGMCAADETVVFSEQGYSNQQAEEPNVPAGYDYNTTFNDKSFTVTADKAKTMTVRAYVYKNDNNVSEIASKSIEFIEKPVIVTIPGDLNKDGMIDIVDVKVFTMFLHEELNPYNLGLEDVDLNGDFIVNFSDMVDWFNNCFKPFVVEHQSLYNEDAVSKVKATTTAQKILIQSDSDLELDHLQYVVKAGNFNSMGGLLFGYYYGIPITTNGVLVNNLKIPTEVVEAGTLLELTDVRAYDRNGNLLKDGQGFHIYFENEITTETKPGDVNGDGEVDVRDITALIDVIMNSITNNQRADVNGDSEIDVRDITALIDIIMNA